MSEDCRHSEATRWPHLVACRLGQYGGLPGPGQCRVCSRREIAATADTNDLGIAVDDRCGDVAQKLNGTNPSLIRPTRVKLVQPEPNLVTLAVKRAEVCATCELNRGITLEKGGWPVYTVKCRACGCNGLKLTTGECKLGKWPDSVYSADATSKNRDALCKPTPAPKILRLRSRLSPGDIVTMTAAVRDLHLSHPGKYLTAIDTAAPELWENNPHVLKESEASDGVENIEMAYPLINQSNQRPVHFIQGYTEFLANRLGVRIATSAFKGDIHLSDQEKNWTNQIDETFGFKGRFWIVMAGGKKDFTTKWWAPDYYQGVVDHFRGRIQFVQCGESHHWHVPLRNVFNLIGKTTIREFVRLVYHAEGVVCPITFAMHLAAAVPTKQQRFRPCVVIAGGREPMHWEAYPGHQYLHTIGALPCCANGGCWKSRCQKVEDGDPKDRENLCELPFHVTNDLSIPRCMAMITPGQVIEAIEKYNLFYQ